ncbi:MAG: PQQ-binding-like beta-propeller repeat protein [Bacteroidota bacterium]
MKQLFIFLFLITLSSDLHAQSCDQRMQEAEQAMANGDFGNAYTFYLLASDTCTDTKGIEKLAEEAYQQFLSATTPGRCPEFKRLMTEADQLALAGNYEFALKKYNAAEVCDPSAETVKNARVDEVFKRILDERDNALNTARASNNSALIYQTLEKDPTLALRMAEYNYLHFADNTGAVTALRETAKKVYKYYQNFFRLSERQILSVAFSPDGRTVATTSKDLTIRIWDTATGEQKLVIPNLASLYFAISFSPNGKNIAAANENGTIKLWDVTTGHQIQTLQGNIHKVFGSAFSPDGKTLAAACVDGPVRIWNLLTGQQSPSLEGHEGPVYNIDFSSDGSTVASAGADRTVRLWDASTGQSILTYDDHDNPVHSVTFSPDSLIMASADLDGDIYIWDRTTGASNRILRGHQGKVSSLTFSEDGISIASSGADQTIRVWDAYSGDLDLTLQGHDGEVFLAAFSSTEETVFSVGQDNILRSWGVFIGQPEQTLKGAESEIVSIAFSPDGTSIVYAAKNSGVHLWNIFSEQPLQIMEENLSKISSVAFSPDGKNFAATGANGIIRLWDTHTPQEPPVALGKDNNVVYAIAFSPDGKTIAATASMTDDSGFTQLWDIDSRERIRNLAYMREREVFSIAFSPDGKTIASSTEDNTIQLWDVASEQLILTLKKGHDEWINSINFSPDGKTLVSASDDKTKNLVIWDIVSGQQTQILTGHEKGVNAAAYSPDGKMIASADEDGNLRIWDVSSGQLILAHQEINNSINSIAFSTDGIRIATAGEDGIIRIYPTRPYATHLAAKFSIEWFLQTGLSLTDYDLQHMPTPDLQAVAAAQYERYGEWERARNLYRQAYKGNNSLPYLLKWYDLSDHIGQPMELDKLALRDSSDWDDILQHFEKSKQWPAALYFHKRITLELKGEKADVEDYLKWHRLSKLAEAHFDMAMLDQFDSEKELGRIASYFAAAGENEIAYEYREKEFWASPTITPFFDFYDHAKRLEKPFTDADYVKYTAKMDASTLTDLAERFDGREQWSQAETVLDAAIARGTTSPELRYQLYLAQQELGKDTFDKIFLTDDLKEVDENQAFFSERVGYFFDDMGEDFVKIKSLSQQIVRLGEHANRLGGRSASPELLEMQANLCQIHIVLGEFAEAESLARRILAENPDEVQAHLFLPLAVLLQGRRAEAEPLFRQWREEELEDEPLASVYQLFLEELDKKGLIPEAYQSDVEAVRTMLKED